MSAIPVEEAPGRLEAAIAAAAARCLQTPERLGPDVPFSLLGLDSLKAIELAAELEDAAGLKLPADVIFECADLRSLTARLLRLGQEQEIATSDELVERMLADAILPDDVRPPAPAAGSTSFERARSILLTGATGFLGGALARELLTGTRATLVCLVRPSATAGESAGRLWRHLASRGVERRMFDSRVRIVEGDLAAPRLGLCDASLDGLSREIDAVVHAGAAVNWVYSYGALRAVNVAGTLELLRLACRHRPIPFHFVSSLSVAYSTRAPRQVDETYDPLPHVRGQHLGYAQSKVVAESLVREAGERGLPIRIYRPALISGDSRTGAFNRDDVIAALIQGCVRMGTAPDLDWKLDSLPVDVVARAVVSLANHPGSVFHLAHPHPRHWRECVLWMRLYGYPIQLVSYPRWLRQLESETAPGVAHQEVHPLRPLRSFFLDRPLGADGLTRPELYEESRRPRATDQRTRDACQEWSTTCPELDTGLLTTYFRAFIDSGALPAPRPVTLAPTVRHRTALCLDRAFFDRVLPGHCVTAAKVLPVTPGTSIISELTAWQSRRPSGVFRVRLTLDEHSKRVTRDVVVKIKPLDSDIVAVGAAVADLCDAAIGRAYARWHDQLGSTASHARELAIYAQTDPRFVRHTPAVLAAVADPSTDTWWLVLEHIDDAVLIDSADRRDAWTADRLELAVQGMAALQAIWYGREPELREMPWIGNVPSADSVNAASELWTALAGHASAAFSSWADPDIGDIQRRLIADIPRWWPLLRQSPQTLIHHDFNPRNICIRGTGVDTRVCAYDWELATIGAPQHDLAELLCFVLPPDASGADIDSWIERHRRGLARHTGSVIASSVWRDGFRAALYDLLINRLAMYALVNRIARQTFLPRVLQAWFRLYQHFRLEH